MKYGYTKETLIDSDSQQQQKVLQDYGCIAIYHNNDFDQLINTLAKEDEVVVTDISVLGATVNEIKNNSVLIQNVDAHVTILNLTNQNTEKDSKSQSKKEKQPFFINILKAIAKLQHVNRIERQKAGIKAAKEAGRYKGGRPKYTEDSQEVQTLLKYAREDPKLSVRKLCQLSGIKSRTTVYSILKEYNIKRGPRFELSIEFNKKS